MINTLHKPKIGLLVPTLSPLAAYESRCVKNDDLMLFTPASIHWSDEEISGLYWNGRSWLRQKTGFPDVVYNRLYDANKKLMNRLEALVGKHKCFNHRNRLNKWNVHQALVTSSMQPYLPETIVYSHKELLPFLAKHQQIIIKPRLGRLGVKIYRIDQTAKALHVYHDSNYPLASFPNEKQLLNYSRGKWQADSITQQYIPFMQIDDRIFDIRLIVQKGADGKWVVTADMSRLALSYAFVTNICHQIIRAKQALDQTAKVPANKLLAKLEKLAITTAQIIDTRLGHFGELSVDFGVDRMGNPWIIEVNGKPDKNLLLEVDYQLYQAALCTPIAYAQYLGKKESGSS